MKKNAQKLNNLHFLHDFQCFTKRNEHEWNDSEMTEKSRDAP